MAALTARIRNLLTSAAVSAAICTSPAFASQPYHPPVHGRLDQIVRNGFVVDVRHGPFGTTALMTNAAQGESLTLLRLLEAGADPRLEDYAGRDSLDYAAEASQTDTARLLVAAMRDTGPEVDAPGVAEGQPETSAISESQAAGDSPEARRLDARFRKLVEQGRYDEALKAAEELLDERRRTHGGLDPLTADAYDNVGDVSLMRRDAAGAEGSYLRAHGIREKTLGTDHPETRSSASRLMSLYSSLGQTDKAEAIRPETSGDASGAGASGGWDSLKKSLAPALKPFLIVSFVGLAGMAAYRARLIPAIIGIGDNREKKARRAFDAKRLCDSARMEERTGNYGGASLLYERSLRLLPDNHQTRFRLARIYQLRLKDAVSARRHYRTLTRTLPQADGLRREALRCLRELGEN